MGTEWSGLPCLRDKNGAIEGGKPSGIQCNINLAGAICLINCRLYVQYCTGFPGLFVSSRL